MLEIHSIYPIGMPIISAISRDFVEKSGIKGA
jgi:hypothetical protein